MLSRWDSKSRESWAVTMAQEHNLAEWFVSCWYQHYIVILNIYRTWIISINNDIAIFTYKQSQLSSWAPWSPWRGTKVWPPCTAASFPVCRGRWLSLQSGVILIVETDFKFRFKEKVKLSFWQLKYPGSEPTSRWRKSTWTLPGRAVDLVWWAAGLLLVLPQVRSLSGFRCGEGGVIRWWWLVMASKLGSSWCPLSRHPGNPCCSTDWCCQGNILVQNQCNA